MRGSSDSGARENAPSGGVAPSTVGLANPMSEYDDAGENTPGTIDALRINQRGDRASHDICQTHLSEFGAVNAGVFAFDGLETRVGGDA